jgi:hypothetical protein
MWAGENQLESICHTTYRGKKRVLPNFDQPVAESSKKTRDQYEELKRHLKSSRNTWRDDYPSLYDFLKPQMLEQLVFSIKSKHKLTIPTYVQADTSAFYALEEAIREIIPDFTFDSHARTLKPLSPKPRKKSPPRVLLPQQSPPKVASKAASPKRMLPKTQTPPKVVSPTPKAPSPKQTPPPRVPSPSPSPLRTASPSPSPLRTASPSPSPLRTASLSSPAQSQTFVDSTESFEATQGEPGMPRRVQMKHQMMNLMENMQNIEDLTDCEMALLHLLRHCLV